MKKDLRKTIFAGDIFGLYKVIKILPYKNKHNQHLALCECECGTIREIELKRLGSGKATNCGCLRKISNINRCTTHNKTHTRIYRIYANIKTRCFNKNHHSYKYYGEKGITICSEWNNDFNAFYDWAIKSGYSEKLSIDRIDCNKGYTPTNCRWANANTQAANIGLKSNNKTGYAGVFKQGETYIANISYQRKRIHLGSFRNIEDAVKKRNEYIKQNNLPHPIVVLEKMYNDIVKERNAR